MYLAVWPALWAGIEAAALVVAFGSAIALIADTFREPCIRR